MGRGVADAAGVEVGTLNCARAVSKACVCAMPVPFACGAERHALSSTAASASEVRSRAAGEKAACVVIPASGRVDVIPKRADPGWEGDAALNPRPRR